MKYLSTGLRMALGITLAITANHLQAQARSTGSHMTVDFAGGITAIHANEGPGQCGCFYMIGGNGEVAITNSQHLAFVTNAGYTSATNINSTNRNLALLTVLEGGPLHRQPRRQAVTLRAAIGGDRPHHVELPYR